MPIAEHEEVILQRDLPEHGLRSGDVGTVVGIYNEAAGYVIEVFNVDGDTIAVATVDAADIVPLKGNYVYHVRRLAG